MMPLKETRRVLLDLYDKFPPADIAEMTGRSVHAIRGMASAMGLRSVGRGRDHWPEFSKREEERIRRDYGVVPVVHLARELGRSVGAIHTKAHRLGLGRRRGRLWTAAEDQTMRDYYPTHGAK